MKTHNFNLPAVVAIAFSVIGMHPAGTRILSSKGFLQERYWTGSTAHDRGPHGAQQAGRVAAVQLLRKQAMQWSMPMWHGSDIMDTVHGWCATQTVHFENESCIWAHDAAGGVGVLTIGFRSAIHA